jgi:hypothetical protein
MITAKSAIKTKEVIKMYYEQNKELFTEFFKLNLDRSNLSKPEFNIVGLQIQSIINDCADKVV